MLDDIGHSLKRSDSVDSVQLARRSGKQPTAAASNNLIMNAVADGAWADEPEVTGIAAALAKWYAAHSSIRRLRALEDPLALIVLVVLEPTSDGDDTLPVWLANCRAWATDLRQLAGREVQLRLLVPNALEAPYVNTDAITIAEVSWRDTW